MGFEVDDPVEVVGAPVAFGDELAGAGRGGGEVDLIMRERDGTLVFVEVRQRTRASHGGAGGSVTAVKQRRIVFAARHFLMRLGSEPPCRFDVVLIQSWPETIAMYLHHAMFTFLGGFVERKNVVRVHQVQITGRIEDAAEVGMGGNPSLN